MRVLLVEDDEILGDALKSTLIQEGYAVDWLRYGNHARQALEMEEFDLVVLDLGLPDRDGLDVLAATRNTGNDVPILVLTARETIPDRVAGLDRGADDYMVKPFDADELHARIRSITRRASGRSAPNIVYRNITVSPKSRSVTRDGEEITLTAREYDVLIRLLENQGRVLSRQHLKESLYGYESDDVDSNTVEVHISHIRKKLGNELIRTIRGVGYMIDKVC